MRVRLAILASSILLLTAVHFTVGTHSHPLHVIHVVFGGLYLVPIIAAAIWFGLRGGIATSIIIAVVYFVHMRVSWPNRPMENINQLVMIGVYLLVGSVSGALVNLQNRERRRRVESEQRAQREVIIQGFAGLCNALEFRDEYTRQHSEQVSRLAVAIGTRQGMPSARLDLLRLAAVVHDIGKIGIRDDILYKPDQLTPEERNRMEQHSVIAAAILRPIQGAEEIAEIVSAHHECPDGSGYPRGLTAEQIPPEALILSVADVYSALTERRPYKSAMAREKALEIITTMAGTKLDAIAVHTLSAWLAEGGDGEEQTDPTLAETRA